MLESHWRCFSITNITIDSLVIKANSKHVRANIESFRLINGQKTKASRGTLT